MKKNYKKMFDLLDMYIKNNIQDADNTIIEAIEERKNGKIFSFNEHIKAMILSMLSGQAEWQRIYRNKNYLDDLFFHYDKDKIKTCNPKFFINGLFQKNIGTTSTKAQMESLNYNISIFEQIVSKYTSLDKFITHDTPIIIVKLLAEKGSKYKLKQLGVPLVCEYMRNTGINIIKPDRHIKRILAPERLNLISSQDDYNVIEIGKQLSEETGISQVKIDYLLWNYCANGYGKICTKINPKCEKCVIKEYCNFDKKVENELKNINSNVKNQKFKIQNLSEEKKLSSLKTEYKKYLSSILIGKKDSTIETYLRDSFYVYKHQDEFGINFWDLFLSRQNIDNFENKLFEQQISIAVRNPQMSTMAYMNGLYRLYDFLNK